MAKCWKVIIPIALGLCLMGQTGWAEKAYVTDSFRISLRRGPSTENKILRFISSGQPVEVYESKEGWNRVRVLEDNPNVIEGWVLSRYLIRRLPWGDQVRSLRKENTRFKEKVAGMDKEWEEKIRHERAQTKELKRNHKATLKTVTELTMEIESFRSSRRIKWFVTGALALLCGLIMGLVARGLRRRRSSLRL